MNEIINSYFEKIEKKIKKYIEVKILNKIKNNTFQRWIDCKKNVFKKLKAQNIDFFTLNSLMYKQIIAVVIFTDIPITH
ncbi:MAG: hypothetical protein ACOVQ2_05695 [Flavobacterium sp.]